jgi:hypothetical protein
VFFSEISMVSAFILSALLFTMDIYLSCLCIGEYFPGKVILCVCNIPCLPLLVFGLTVCISIAVYSKREAIFLIRCGILLDILLTLFSQL